MPDQLPVIEAEITVSNVKEYPYDRSDGTQGIRTSVGWRQPDGSWLNFSCFDTELFPHLTKGKKLTVGYTEKYATNPNGSPKLDESGQQIIYRNIVSVVGAHELSAKATGEATQSYDPGLGAYQTALNCATQLTAAVVTTSKALADDFFKGRTLEEVVMETAAIFHLYLTTGKANPLDQFMEATKETLDTSEDPDLVF
jgi:hypothetical protein